VSAAVTFLHPALHSSFTSESSRRIYTAFGAKVLWAGEEGEGIPEASRSFVAVSPVGQWRPGAGGIETLG
jgi:hypothetical protein